MQVDLFNQDLVQNVNGELLVSSLVVAENVDYEHDTVSKLIRDNVKDFEEFGTVRFTDLKSENPKGGRPQRIYLLNENQSTLICSRVKHGR